MEAGLSELATGQTVTVSSQSLINGLGFLALFGLGIWLAENALKRVKNPRRLRTISIIWRGWMNMKKRIQTKGLFFVRLLLTKIGRDG